MIQIQDTLVSLDLVERFFCCDLDDCKGACCLDGDAGAPLEPGEADTLRRILPEIWNDLLPAARREIEANGVSYTDVEGDEVTSLVEGGNCVFSTLDENGGLICAIERAFRLGRIDYYKPISCHLYPVRLKRFDTFTAVNYHRWKICRSAEQLGRKLGVRLYQFLEGPLTAHFGREWYDELKMACEVYLEEYGDK